MSARAPKGLESNREESNSPDLMDQWGTDPPHLGPCQHEYRRQLILDGPVENRPSIFRTMSVRAPKGIK